MTYVRPQHLEMCDKDAYLGEFRTWLQDAGFESDPRSANVWNGSVSSDWVDPRTGKHTSAEHRVAVFLPPGFPYCAPIVISKDSPPLGPSLHLSPEPGRSLCLWNSQTGWEPHFTAQGLLERIADWFRCYHTDSWPANSEVPDLHRYLEVIGTVVTGNEWTPPAGHRSGRFFLWRHRRFLSEFACLVSCNEEPETRLSHYLLTQERDRNSGAWFRLEGPIVPPNNLRDLLYLVDTASSVARGWTAKECQGVFGHKLSGDGFPIALGYPDNRNMERWLFLWAKLSGGEKSRQKIYWSDPNRLSSITVASFRTGPAGTNDLLRRSAHVSTHLASCSAVVFGLGALGSSIAMLLAKAGIGEIRLVDSDTLMPGNVVRHVCGLTGVGSKKTTAMKFAIQAHNPDCHTEIYESTWKAEDLQIRMKGCNVAVDATADHNFSLHLNEVCLACNQPIIFATTYRRASVGRIIVHRGSTDPCLACYEGAAQFWAEDAYPTIPVAPEGTFVEDGCAAPTEEAVALDVETVANLVARTAIKAMRAQLGDENLAILVNEPVSNSSGILTQTGTHWRANKPLTQCSICQPGTHVE